MAQWFKNQVRRIKRKARNFNFWYQGHDDALQRIFDMSDPDSVPSDLDFSTDTFEKLMIACGIKIVHRWPYDGWELHFKGKCKRIYGPQGSHVNITTIGAVRNFLVEAGVKNPSMIYDHLPGA